MAVKNSTLFELARKYNPEFARHTAKITASRLDLGWEANKAFATDPQPINDWFAIVMTWALQKVDIAEVRDVLMEAGLVEAFDTPFGNAIQRIAVNQIKPVSPKFRGLQDGDSIDMFTVRKPDLDERFFTQNFDFQNFITLQEYQIKLILQNEFGMEQVTGGIVKQLENSFKTQRYLNTLEALNAGINSSDYPLKDTQVVEMDSWGSGTGGAVTDAELLNFIQAVKKMSYALSITPSTKAYNAAGFDTAVDPSNFVLLIRPDILVDIQTKLRVGAYNPEDISLPFEVQAVENFGGMVPYVDVPDTSAGAQEGDTVATQVYPIYDSLGVVIGYDTDKTATDPDYDEDDIYWVDGNDGVLAVLAQKGLIFTTMQNGIQQVVTPYNARGAYQNIFYNVIGAGVHYDYYYDMITFNAPSDDDDDD